MKALKISLISLFLFALSGHAFAGYGYGHPPMVVPPYVGEGFGFFGRPAFNVPDGTGWGKGTVFNPARAPIHHRGRGGGFGIFPPPYGFGFPYMPPSGFGFPYMPPSGFGFPYMPPSGFGFPYMPPSGFGFPYMPPSGFGFPYMFPSGFGFSPIVRSWGLPGVPGAPMTSPLAVRCAFGKEVLLAASVESCENAGGKVEPASPAPPQGSPGESGG